MGIKRGAFESTQLRQVAESAKNPNVQIDSLARGMRAFGAGLGAVGDYFGKLGKMADKAYGAYKANAKGFSDSLNGLAAGKAKLDEVRQTYKGREDTQEGRDAIKAAQTAYDELQRKSDEALDKYKRTGIIMPQIGTANAESGRQRRMAATKKVVGEDGVEREVFDVRDASRQSMLGGMFGQLW